MIGIIRTMFGVRRVTTMDGYGVGPRTYTCEFCHRRMLRSAEVVRRHMSVHGQTLTLATAHRIATEDLHER